MMVDSSVLHNRLLSIMKEFHTFCVENNITYYMLGGTALGAKRHAGFIPWDDDMDIGIPRNDYERLIKLNNSARKQMELLQNNKSIKKLELLENKDNKDRIMIE